MERRSAPCSHSVNRRDFIKVGALTYLGLGLSQLLEAPVQAAEPAAKSVILLWMDGGPPHMDLWDPKPEAQSSCKSEFSQIATNVPGVKFTELLPSMAKQMDKVTLLRSLSHDEGAHERAQHTLLTGWHPTPSLIYPSIGSVVSKELGPSGSLPSYIAVPDASFGTGYGHAGYLEGAYNPFSVGGDPNNKNFRVQDVSLPDRIPVDRFNRRRALLDSLDALRQRFEAMPESKARSAFYERAFDMILSPQAKKAFNLNDEPDKLRDAYGRHTFGQGCLLARRLVESGVRFVTVSMGGWDTHSENFKALRDHLGPQTDQGFSTLLKDLADRGLLKETLVVWMGEFGRTPQVNPLAGRDHWPNAQCAVLAGAGVPGGQVIGATDRDGANPSDRKVSPADLAATIYGKLGIDYTKQYITPQKRPVQILADASPVKELG